MSNEAAIQAAAVERRYHAVRAKIDLERQNALSSGPAATGVEQAGPPYWSRAAWDAYKAQHGFYPFGPQGDLGFVRPPTMDGAPDWVYELMGMRRPPVEVNAQAAGGLLGDVDTPADDLPIWGMK